MKKMILADNSICFNKVYEWQYDFKIPRMPESEQKYDKENEPFEFENQFKDLNEILVGFYPMTS